MSKRRLTVEWQGIDGAAKKKRVLHLKRNESDIYLCPVADCLHVGFKSERGVRKHVGNIHPWYYFFDSKPDVSRSIATPFKANYKNTTHKFPAFSIESGEGLNFVEWLETDCGGGKKKERSSTNC